MTQLEKDKELTEILNYKFALTKKIEWNKAELLKIEMAINHKGYVKDLPELKRLERTGRKLLSIHRKERFKLSNERIAKELGVGYHIVRYRWDEKVRLAP